MTYYTGDRDRNWPLGMSRLPVDYRPEHPAKDGADDLPAYNPERTYYYNASDTVIKIEESFNGRTYTQTISGTGNYADQAVSYYATYSAWEETTVS